MLRGRREFRERLDRLEAGIREQAQAFEQTRLEIQATRDAIAGAISDSTEEFHMAVVGAVEADVQSRATARYRAWQKKGFAEGRFAVVREYTRRIPCPCGRDFDIRVTSQYIAQVVAGFRPGGLFPRLGQPGIALEHCPACGRTVRLTLEDLVG